MKKGLLLVILLCAASLVFSQKQGDTLYVAAHSGLNMRNEPGTKGAKIIALPKESMVVVVSDVDSSLSYSVTEFPGFSIKGHWVQVDYKGQVGYVFSGYLTAYEPPIKNFWNDTYDLESRESYLVRIFRTEDIGSGYKGDTCVRDWYQRLTENIAYRKEGGCGEWSGKEYLEFENHSLQEVYLLFLMLRKWPCSPVWDSKNKRIHLSEDDIHDVIWSIDEIYEEDGKILWLSYGGC